MKFTLLDNQNYKNHNNQEGSIFFYILIAVALFAALSYAVSRNNDGSTNVFTEEQAKIAAQEIIEYGNTVATAVQKLRLRGCSDTEISFENDIVSGYTNASSPSDKSCHVFDVNGGNINWQAIPEERLESDHSAYNAYGQIYFGDKVQIESIGDTCSTSDCTDLIFQGPHLKKEICEMINFTLGYGSLASINEAVHNYLYRDSAKFTGVYDFESAGDTSTIGDDFFPSGKINGCIYRSGGGLVGNPYTFYQVLIAR